MKLLAPDEDAHGNVAESDKLLAAIKTIIVADLVMSVDNVIAIAGAAQSSGEHSTLLVVLGLLISIPIIVWGSQLVIKLMERFPMIITAGGMLLGWIAGGMLVTDPAFVNPDKWQWMPKLGTVDSNGMAEISRPVLDGPCRRRAAGAGHRQVHHPRRGATDSGAARRCGLLLKWLLSAAALLCVACVYSGVEVHSFGAAPGAAFVIGLFNVVLRPILVILTLPVTIVTIGLFLFVINALMFWAAARCWATVFRCMASRRR